MTTVTLNFFGHEFKAQVHDVEARVGIAHYNVTLGGVTKRVTFYRDRGDVFYSTIEGLLLEHEAGG